LGTLRFSVASRNPGGDRVSDPVLVDVLLTRLDDAIILLHEDVEFVIWARKIVESALGCSFAALPPISPTGFDPLRRRWCTRERSRDTSNRSNLAPLRPCALILPLHNDFARPPSLSSRCDGADALPRTCFQPDENDSDIRTSTKAAKSARRCCRLSAKACRFDHGPAPPPSGCEATLLSSRRPSPPNGQLRTLRKRHNANANSAVPMPKRARNWGQTMSRPAPRKTIACASMTK
jgi:hypothetical protein